MLSYLLGQIVLMDKAQPSIVKSLYHRLTNCIYFQSATDHLLLEISRLKSIIEFPKVKRLYQGSGLHIDKVLRFYIATDDFRSLLGRYRPKKLTFIVFVDPEFLKFDLRFVTDRKTSELLFTVRSSFEIGWYRT